VRPFILILVMVALGVDVAQWLRAAPLWVDEEMIALNLRDRSFADLAGPLWLGQGAPLGWLIVQRAMLLLCGASELCLRFFPLVAGAATILAALWVATRWLHPLPAVLFLLLISIGQWVSHYRFELKHYSVDTFAALLLPALAAWVVETRDDGEVEERWTRWWIVASLIQWISYGALLVMPLCALILSGALYRRLGLRGVLRFAAMGSVWLASFAVHYGLSLQYTDNNRYLRDYWAGHILPRGLDAAGVVAWIGERFERLANNPGGSDWVVAFWCAALLGCVVTRRHLLGAMFASVPVAGFVLAVIRQVPLEDRLALWIVPSLYAGIALLLDAGIHLGRSQHGRRRLAMALGGVLAAGAFVVGAHVIVRGYRHLDVGVPAVSNRDLDDRSAVAWLQARHRPGDVIVTTQLGWPAIWWYAGLSIREHALGRELPDGTAVLTASQERERSNCRQQFFEALKGRERVLLYAGFPDEGVSFYDAFVSAVEPYGIVIDFARFGATSLVAVVELFVPSGVTFLGDTNITPSDHPMQPGCVTLRPARRW
jgi:hypothetical protein